MNKEYFVKFNNIEKSLLIGLVFSILLSIVSFQSKCDIISEKVFRLHVIANSDSFEDSIRKVLYMGGDTDTNACIVGSISESLYGMTEEETCFAKRDLPKEFVKVLNKVYK